MNIALVASEYNAPLPDRMLEVAEAAAGGLGAKVVAVVRVPGAWEIPVAVRRQLGRREVDAAVALAAIVKGETLHDELIAHAVARALQDVQLETGKPVGLGITGPGMTWAQAEARVGNAARAVEAAVRMAKAPRASRGSGSRTRRGR